MWGDPNAVMHGRTGQPQAGVDIYGHDRDKRFTGVQCKGKNGDYHGQLTKKELRDEVEKAKGFSPSLQVFVVATTASDDVGLLAFARELTAKHAKVGLFEVHVHGWDTLRLRLAENPDIAREHLSLVGNAVVLEAVQGSRAEQAAGHQILLAQVEALTAAMATLVQRNPQVSSGSEPLEDPSNEPLRTRIKDAAELSNDGQARAAVALLDRIRAEAWETSSPRNRHRLLNAMGFAHLALDEVTQSVVALRDASAADPGKPWSLAALAFAEFLDGNRERSFEVARQSLQGDPSLEQAALALLHAAPLGMPLDDVVGLLPDGLVGKPQTRMALCSAAQARSDHVAALQHAEAAYAVEPGDWRTQTMLAHELMRPALANEGVGLTRLVPEAERAAFTRALSLLRAAWRTVAGNSFGPRMPEMALNLASVLEVAGEDCEAEAVVDEALRLRPGFSLLLHRKAFFSATRGDWADVLQLIGQVPVGEREPDASLIEARALLETGKPADARATAEQLLDGLRPPRVADAAAAVSLEARVASGEAGPQEVLAAWAASPNSMMVRVAVLPLAREHEALRRQLLSDVDHFLSGQGLDPRDVALAATALRTLGEPSRAADVLEPLVASDRHTPLLADRLRALLDADRRKEARELFERLPPAVRQLGTYVELGVRLFERIGLLQRARTLLEEHLSSHPEDLQARLNWLGLCERMQDAPRAVAWLKGLDPALPGRPRELMALAHAMDRLLASPVSLRLGYRALRDGFADTQIHLGYAFGLFIMGCAIRAGRPVPDRVGLDTAVTLQACDGQGSLVRVIESEADPRLERFEISPTDPFAKRLEGLAVGDEISMPDMLNKPVRLRVAAIQDKYLHAHFSVLEHFAARFPEARSFGTVQLGSEDDPNRFEPMFHMARMRAESVRELEAKYREGGLPLAFVAKMSGCNVLDVWEGLARRRDVSIRCALGTPEERAEALRRLGAAEVCVADPLTLYIAVHLGIADLLRASAGTLAVTQTTLDHLSEALAERRRDCDGGRRGILVWTGEHYVMHEASPEALAESANRAERTLRFAQGCTLVTAEGQQPVSQQAVEVFGNVPDAYLDTARAASEQGRLLVCEDWPMRTLSEAATGAHGVWLQAALLHGLTSGRIGAAQYAEATGKLLQAGHHFTTYGWLEISHELRQHSWLPLGRTEDYFRTMARPDQEAEGLARLAAELLVKTYLATGGGWRFGATISSLFRQFAQVHGSASLCELAAGWVEQVEQALKAELAMGDKRTWLGSTFLTPMERAGDRRRAAARRLSLLIDSAVSEVMDQFGKLEAKADDLRPAK